MKRLLFNFPPALSLHGGSSLQILFFFIMLLKYYLYIKCHSALPVTYFNTFFPTPLLSHTRAAYLNYSWSKQTASLRDFRSYHLKIWCLKRNKRAMGHTWNTLTLVLLFCCLPTWAEETLIWQVMCLGSFKKFDFFLRNEVWKHHLKSGRLSDVTFSLSYP